MANFKLFMSMLAVWGLTKPLLAETDLQLAQRVAATVGIGQEGRCSSCHATSALATIQRWSQQFQRVEACMVEGDARQKLSCIAESSASETLPLVAAQLGFYSAGLHLPPLQALMLEAYGAAKTAELNAELRQGTSMPLRDPNLLSASEFADIQTWIRRGMPHLNELLHSPTEPTTCESSLSPAIKDHLLQTDLDGWESRNSSRDMQMFACSPSKTSCFTQERDGKAVFPDLSTLPGSRGWKTAAQDQQRLLFTLNERTDYWIRSSADGRFIAYGGTPSGIIDLQTQLLAAAPARVIEVDAYYDPGFFPDDSAFMFQGSQTGICNMSLLKNPATTRIDFSEDACTAGDQTEIPLYQAIGASLDGNDYLAVTGGFISDPGDGTLFRETSQETFFAQPRNGLFLYPLQYDGQRWVRGNPQVFDAGKELDWGLSPSNRLLVSRKLTSIEGRLQHLSYQFYQLSRTEDQKYQREPAGTLCLNGLKGNFSFDDRFYVTYNHLKPEHYALLGYASVDDPEFQKLLLAGSGNIFLFDLLSQKTVALTHMGAGQYAQFPHFRSDGWIYYMVFDANNQQRLLIASDAALKAKRENPTQSFR